MALWSVGFLGDDSDGPSVPMTFGHFDRFARVLE